MKTFRIGVLEEIGGYVRIKAKTQEEAKEIAQQTLDEEGIGGFWELKTTRRECSIFECEDVAYD